MEPESVSLKKPELASYLMYGGNEEKSRHLMITSKKNTLIYFGHQTCVVAKDAKKPQDLTIVTTSEKFMKKMKQRAKDLNNPVFIKFTNISKTGDKLEDVQNQTKEFLMRYKRVAYWEPSDLSKLDNDLTIYFVNPLDYLTIFNVYTAIRKIIEDNSE